jgi:hypothetical protein
MLRLRRLRYELLTYLKEYPCPSEETDVDLLMP